ncbi:MAG: class I SAM-dependent methyltransferase [Gammaproteobacteria bacterium]|nr:class I SAM-dependent methyltransferase [Gammaproteobacteria bacterium]
MTEGDGESARRGVSNYWDTLAPHHWRVENNYLDVSSLRRIVDDIRQPVLIIGAGQGLIVEELRRQGLRCDGIDLSATMLEYARSRRGLTLVRANATSMPFVDGSYETVIFATGVIDFMAATACRCGSTTGRHQAAAIWCGCHTKKRRQGSWAGSLEDARAG